MDYFSKVPSYSDVKGFLSNSLTSVKEGFDTYYPVVRDAAKDYYKTGKDHAGRAAIWIKDKAIEYPGSAVAVANAAVVVLVAGKVTSAVDYLLSFVFRKEEEKDDLRLKISAGVTILAIIGADIALWAGTGFQTTIALGAAVGISLGMAIKYARGAIEKNSENKLKNLRNEFKISFNKLEDKSDFVKSLTAAELRRLINQMKSFPMKSFPTKPAEED